MNVLIINPILYTAERKEIPKVNTIKDTMIYDLCLGFMAGGHNVTLYAADAYKPVCEEKYPFEIMWGHCCWQNIFTPSRFPYMPSLKKFLSENNFDLIISSEVFSISTYIAYKYCKEKVIAWHEIAKHQAMMHQIPSKIWYNVVTKHFMPKLRVVARSNEAKTFISRYCKNTENTIIDHGVNLKKFEAKTEKNNHFIVCAQLIPRKKIDGIIDSFREFVEKVNSDFVLYIVGDGECRQTLEKQVESLELQEQVIFTGKLAHEKLSPILSSAMALLVNTEKDNNMISIVESIAVGTPVLTTEVPLNASYIKSNELGIAKNGWGSLELSEIVNHNDIYVKNCLEYRKKLATEYKARQFIEL